MNPRLQHVLICAGLAILTAAAMGRVVGNDFVTIDDPMYVTANDNVQAGLSSRNVKWAWTTNHAGFWIPLTWMSLELDATLYWPKSTSPGGDPAAAAAWGFHLTNLLLHIANTVLVYWLTFRLLESVGGAAFVAALFGVHPLHVESVAWVTERKDVLSVFFGLLALLAYVRYQEKPAWGRMALVALLQAMSLMAKPLLVTLPAVMLLLDCWPLKRWGKVSAGRLLAEKLPLFALSALWTLITVHAQRDVHAVPTLEILPLSARLGNAALSYESYLVDTFWPLHLGVFYPHPLLYPRLRDPLIWYAVGRAALVLLAVTAAALAARKAVPGLLVGWLWFVGTLVPNIGLVQAGNQGSADRFTYFPLLGLFLAAMCGGAYLARRLHLRAAVLAGTAGLLVAGLTILTWVQAGYWENSQTLYEHTLRVTRKNAYVHMLLGMYFYKHGDLKNAESQLAQSKAIRESGFVEFHYTYGCVLLERGKREKDAEALTQAWYHLQKCVEVHPGIFDFDASFKLAECQLALNRPDAARETIQRVLPMVADLSEVQARFRELLRRCVESGKKP